MSHPVPDNRLIVGGSDTAHYPWPPGIPGDLDPLSPLCGHTDSPVRSVPAVSGQSLCRRCANKGRTQFGW